MEKLVLVDNYFLYGAYIKTVDLIMLHSYTAWQAHNNAGPSAEQLPNLIDLFPCTLETVSFCLLPAARPPHLPTF